MSSVLNDEVRELVEDRYLFNGLRKSIKDWSDEVVLKIYNRMLSVLDPGYSRPNSVTSKQGRLYTARYLQRIGMGHLVPKSDDLTHHNKALKIITTLDDRIIAKYNREAASKRIRAVLKQECLNNKQKTFSDQENVEPNMQQMQPKQKSVNGGGKAKPRMLDPNLPTFSREPILEDVQPILKGRQLPRTPVKAEELDEDVKEYIKKENGSNSTTSIKTPEARPSNDVPSLPPEGKDRVSVLSEVKNVIPNGRQIPRTPMVGDYSTAISPKHDVSVEELNSKAYQKSSRASPHQYQANDEYEIFESHREKVVINDSCNENVSLGKTDMIEERYVDTIRNNSKTKRNVPVSMESKDIHLIANNKDICISPDLIRQETVVTETNNCVSSGDERSMVPLVRNLGMTSSCSSMQKGFEPNLTSSCGEVAEPHSRNSLEKSKGESNLLPVEFKDDNNINKEDFVVSQEHHEVKLCGSVNVELSFNDSSNFGTPIFFKDKKMESRRPDQKKTFTNQEVLHPQSQEVYKENHVHGDPDSTQNLSKRLSNEKVVTSIESDLLVNSPVNQKQHSDDTRLEQDSTTEATSSSVSKDKANEVLSRKSVITQKEFFLMDDMPLPITGTPDIVDNSLSVRECQKNVIPQGKQLKRTPTGPSPPEENVKGCVLVDYSVHENSNSSCEVTKLDPSLDFSLQIFVKSKKLVGPKLKEADNSASSSSVAMEDSKTMVSSDAIGKTGRLIVPKQIFKEEPNVSVDTSLQNIEYAEKCVSLSAEKDEQVVIDDRNSCKVGITSENSTLNKEKNTLVITDSVKEENVPNVENSVKEQNSPVVTNWVKCDPSEKIDNQNEDQKCIAIIGKAEGEPHESTDKVEDSYLVKEESIFSDSFEIFPLKTQKRYKERKNGDLKGDQHISNSDKDNRKCWEALDKVEEREKEVLTSCRDKDNTRVKDECVMGKGDHKKEVPQVEKALPGLRKKASRVKSKDVKPVNEISNIQDCQGEKAEIREEVSLLKNLDANVSLLPSKRQNGNVRRTTSRRQKKTEVDTELNTRDIDINIDKSYNKTAMSFALKDKKNVASEEELSKHERKTNTKKILMVSCSMSVASLQRETDSFVVPRENTKANPKTVNKAVTKGSKKATKNDIVDSKVTNIICTSNEESNLSLAETSVSKDKSKSCKSASEKAKKQSEPYNTRKVPVNGTSKNIVDVKSTTVEPRRSTRTKRGTTMANEAVENENISKISVNENEIMTQSLAPIKECEKTESKMVRSSKDSKTTANRNVKEELKTSRSSRSKTTDTKLVKKDEQIPKNKRSCNNNTTDVDALQIKKKRVSKITIDKEIDAMTSKVENKDLERSAIATKQGNNQVSSGKQRIDRKKKSVEVVKGKLNHQDSELVSKSVAEHKDHTSMNDANAIKSRSSDGNPNSLMETDISCIEVKPSSRKRASNVSKGPSLPFGPTVAKRKASSRKVCETVSEAKSDKTLEEVSLKGKKTVKNKGCDNAKLVDASAFKKKVTQKVSRGKNVIDENMDKEQSAGIGRPSRRCKTVAAAAITKAFEETDLFLKHKKSCRY